MSLSAKTVLVTGASRGLGLEFVRQLLALPKPPEVLIAACRDPEKAEDLQSLAKSNRAVRVVKLDVEKDEDIEKAVKVISGYVGEKGLNLLINNAAILSRQIQGVLTDVTRTILQEHFNVNVSSPVILTQKFLPLLRKAASLSGTKELSTSKAAVVMISSIISSQGSQDTIPPEHSFMHYKLSKTALNMATILAARELRSDGILVTALHPGWVKTDMGTSAAPLTAEESIKDCLQAIAKAGEESNGKLIDFKGNILPY
ncbi:C-factor-like [Biomphalaria glabrata]|uniref:C-factor-like n=1 Tax=Biomphalaria glabrata TaxID=6526 RepID=A0A9W2YNB4_BIOGL|nr:C-factor-like [Biomphalaria glabrata]